jgi:hypothetical protein
VTTELVIEERFCGPPDSGNGGYVCGTVASALGGSDVEVTLMAPPPLRRPLTLEHQEGADEAKLLDGDVVIAVARTAPPVELPHDAPPLLSFDDAVDAASAFDTDEYRSAHEFPRCFTCGPDRHEDDGLRIFPAATDRPDRVVWPWTPPASLFDAGTVDGRLLWAALDCPSGLAWIRQDPEMGAVVLGRMATTIHRSPVPGERLVVTGWSEEPDGRKRPARSAIHTDGGEVLGTSRATWVVLTEEQRSAFGSSRG